MNLMLLIVMLVLQQTPAERAYYPNNRQLRSNNLPLRRTRTRTPNSGHRS